jgi:hypothetical protein
MRRLLVTAATTVAMAVAPTMASAQRTSTPVPTGATEIQPSSEQVGGSELRHSGFILPLLVLVAIILALTFTLKDKHEDLPTSP